MAREPYIVLGVGFLLMVIAFGAQEASFYVKQPSPMETDFLVSGTPLGVLFIVLGWSLIMVAIGLSFGLARRKH